MHICGRQVLAKTVMKLIGDTMPLPFFTFYNSFYSSLISFSLFCNIKGKYQSLLLVFEVYIRTGYFALQYCAVFCLLTPHIKPALRFFQILLSFVTDLLPLLGKKQFKYCHLKKFFFAISEQVCQRFIY